MKQFNKKISLSLISSTAWIALNIIILIGNNGNWSIIAFYVLSLLLISNFMLWWTVFSQDMQPIQLTFWLFHVNFMLLPALSQVLLGIFYWPPYTPYQYNETNLADASGLIGIGLFFFILGNKFISFNTKTPSINNVIVQKLSTKSILLTNTSIFLLGLLVAIQIGFILVFGPEHYMSNRSEQASIIRSISMVEKGISIDLPRAIGVGSFLFTVGLFFQQRQRKKRFSIGLIFIAILVFSTNFIINFPLSLPRFWFFGFFLSLIFIIFPLRTVMSRATFIVMFSIAQFTIFPWFSLITRNSTGLRNLNIETIRNYLLHGDFDTFQQMVNITLYLNEVGFQYGKSLLSVALFFIPRSLWEKAEPLGPAAAEYMGYPYTNLSAPIHAELYADFGLISLIIGMLILGIMIRRLDYTYHRLAMLGKIEVNIIFVSTIAGFMLIILRGSLLGIIASLAVLIGTLLVLGWSVKQYKKERINHTKK